MGIIAGPSMLKFMSIIFYSMLIIGMIAGIINGIVVWKDTGDWKPVVDATIGQVVYSDGQIDSAMEQLKSGEVINTLPENLRSDYKSALAKQVLIYVALFIIVGFLMYKVGNWFAGRSQLDPTTDLMIIGIILLIFAFAEFSYGLLMNKPNIIPFKGIVNWLWNFGVWWDALAGVLTPVAIQTTADIVPIVTDNVSKIIIVPTGG